MADIAFLLLIFFLVTTTMETDLGIMRILPPIADEEPPVSVHERDVLEVLLNDADELLVEGRVSAMADLRTAVKEFMTNPGGRADLPEMRTVTMEAVQQELDGTEGDPADADASRERWAEHRDAVELLGAFRTIPPNAVISLRTGMGSSYAVYVQVQNELEAAIAELRDDLSREKYRRPFAELDESIAAERRMIRAVRMAFPQRISEAGPMDIQNP